MNPILINLSGDFVVDGSGQHAGSITGDIRLESLDAFLHALRNSVSGKTESKFEFALNQILQQCAEGRKISDAGLKLRITSKLKPEKNELTYTFKIC